MSRPVTIEELRRVLEAMRQGHWYAVNDGKLALLTRSAVGAALDALPAEQEQPRLGSPAGSASYVAPSEPSSAVPELPLLNYHKSFSPDGIRTMVDERDYESIRTAAESLRKRLVEALRERDAASAEAQNGEHWHKQWQSECVENISLRKQLVPALQERDEARALAWEQAERTQYAQFRVRNHEIAAENLRIVVDALQAQIDQAQRQEPCVWTEGQPPHPYGNEWFIAQLRNGGRAVLHALPEHYAYDFTTEDGTHYKADAIARWMQFPDSIYVAYAATADVAQQIAAAEQRGRAAAFEEAAVTCREVFEWCRAKAEEARG